MSAAIYMKVSLKQLFYDTATSRFLFNVVEEGCKRNIAITVVPDELIEAEMGGCEKDECILNLSDSFNFTFATPLVGRDIDGEVEEYRPQPLHDRLCNLQELFQFVLKQELVKQIEVFFTTNYDVGDLEPVDADPNNFATVFEPIIVDNEYIELYHRFVWKA